MPSGEIIFGIGALLLAGALAWGIVSNSRRNRANDRITEEATKALYEDQAHYDQRREDLNRQLRP